MGVLCAVDPKRKVHRLSTSRPSGQEIWALPMTGLLPSARRPIKLTAGPLSYTAPVVSRDGNRIFVLGTKKRGEVVRYDGVIEAVRPFPVGHLGFRPDFFPGRRLGRVHSLPRQYSMAQPQRRI